MLSRREYCTSFVLGFKTVVTDWALSKSAVFSRALAELKYMGMVKSSRKKADHLAKVLWNGL